MSQPHTQRKPYDGLQRKIIIAFDIGTTFSGASYALLIPGEPPVIQGVTQYVTALKSTEHLALGYSPDFPVNRRLAAIPRYQVLFVTMRMEMWLLLVRKRTQMPILSFWKWRVLLGLNGTLRLFSSRLSSKMTIGSSYTSAQPILLPSKGSTSKIYLPCPGTRRLSTFSAIF